MGQIPILLLSDGPASSTGLGRITRELAVRIHQHLGETFRVACYGLGGVYSSKLPFPQYQITSLSNWAPPDLPRVWEDFSRGEKGVLMTIWNPSSLQWLVEPEKYAPQGMTRDFLMSKPFEKWGYFPIDAEGPNGKLPAEVADVIGKFDRVLAYTEWAAGLIDQSVLHKGFRAEFPTCKHLPHGTDTSIFYPRDRAESRKNFLGTVTGSGKTMPIRDEVFMVGIVATNSGRKNWGLGFEVCQELLKRGVNVGVWAHTNANKKHWDIMAMVEAFGMRNRAVVTMNDLSDEKMAEAYSALDVTLGIGDGEGHGLPIFESIACGVPCVHIDYAGAAENLPDAYKVEPISFYGEGLYCHRRPVSNPKEWADAIQAVAGHPAVLKKGLSWNECWPRWQEWFLEGING